MRSGLKIWRDINGIPHVEATNRPDMYWGQGYVHAMDRGMQMLLMRILAQGRASEFLDSSDETLEIDDRRIRDLNGKVWTVLEKVAANL